MSGHSKWSNIKRKKAANDLVQGKIFAKLAKQITLAVVESGGIGDPNYNVKLRLAISRAKEENLPKENIVRAIKKGEGLKKGSLEEIVYEGFAPGGVALLIVTMTDNRNRTLPEIKHVLEERGGKLAEKGSVDYLFKKSGRLSFSRAETSEDEVLKLAEQFSAFDIGKNEDHYYLYIEFKNIGRVAALAQEMGIQAPKIIFKPNMPIKIDDRGEREKIEKLVAALNDLDDVQEVFTNLC